jgi:hypothetical protein
MGQDLALSQYRRAVAAGALLGPGAFLMALATQRAADAWAARPDLAQALSQLGAAWAIFGLGVSLAGAVLTGVGLFLTLWARGPALPAFLGHLAWVALALAALWPMVNL